MKRLSLVLFSLLLVSGIVFAQEELLPSVANKEIRSAINEKYDSMTKDEQTTASYSEVRKTVAENILPTVKIDNLDAKEMSSLAYIHKIAYNYKDACRIYKEIAEKNNDAVGYSAALDYINISIRNLNMPFTIAKSKIDEFEARFPVKINGNANFYQSRYFLIKRLLQKSKPFEALEYLESVLENIDENKPTFAWVFLTNTYVDIYRALGQAEEGERLSRLWSDKLEDVVARMKENKTADSTDEYEAKIKSYERAVSTKLSVDNKTTLVGKQAPGFEFTHFFNIEPFKFEELRGKVVVLDFFANWCGPCIATFPHIREFYNEFEGQDVMFMAVTGFQGSMKNHGSDPVDDIDEKKEIELTKQFIEHQNMTWPLVFSTRNCFDIEYGVNGIPHIVVLDKKGIVRFVCHPAKQEELKKWVRDLLAEN